MRRRDLPPAGWREAGQIERLLRREIDDHESNRLGQMASRAHGPRVARALGFWSG